ncbi:microtubule-associated protein futsch-like [Cyclospora cayetanensis]|uniref:Microtubule-associated protein futsch-like n=1 Tax=Cyclospora cayetanensis TaxID=88456 RepID=A0A6P6S0F1_9EIME|nr:microtubule-associated protein futsch-like [Cyclospora cayetanensis]
MQTPLSPVSLEGLLACAEAPESVAPPQLREIPPGHLQDAAKLTPERGASDGAKSCMSSSSATPTRGSIDTQYPPEGLPKALTEHQLESSPSLRAERSGNSHSSRDADTDSDNTLASSLNEPSRGQEAFLARDEFAQAAKSVPFPKLAEEASFQKANNECRMALGDLQRPASSAKPLSIQGGCTPLDGSPFTTAPHADQTLFLPAVPQEPHVHEAGLLSPRNSSAFCSLSSSLDGDSFFEDFVEGNQEGSQAAVASEVEPLVKVTGYKETSSLLHSEAQLHDTFTLFLEQREQQQGQQHRHVGADSNQDAGVGDPEGNAVSIRAGSVALAAKPSDAFAEAGKLVRKAERKTWASTQNAELEGMHTHATAERITGQASAAAKAVRPPPTQALPRSVISAGTEKTHAGHLEPSSGAVSQGSNAAAMPAGGTSAAQALDTDAAQNVCAAPPALKLPEVFLADAPDTTERAGAKGYTTHIGTSSIRSAVHALPFEDIAIGGDPTAAEAARANSAESAVVEAKAAAAAAGCAQQAKERVVDTVAASSAMLRATTDATPAAGAAVATAAESESMKKAVVANAVTVPRLAPRAVAEAAAANNAAAEDTASEAATPATVPEKTKREAESKGAHTSSVAGVPERPAATAAAIGERVATDSTAGASASMKAYVSAKKAVEASQLLASAAAAAIAGRRQASEATADATAFADAAASKALEAVASAQKCTDAEFRSAAEQRLQALVTAARASEQAAACSRSAAEAASAHAADAAADAEKQDQEADAYKGAAKSAALAAQEAANIAYGIVAEIEQQAATAFATLQRAQTEAEVAYGELKAASKQEETKIKELSSAAAVIAAELQAQRETATVHVAESRLHVEAAAAAAATVRVVQEAAEAASGCVSAAEKHHRACEEAARRALQAAAAANAAAAELHMHKEEAATNAARTRNHWEVAAMHCAGVEQHLLDAATDAKQVQEHAIAVTTAATTAADQLQHVKDSGNLARAAAAAAQEASDVAAGIVAGLQQKQAAATAIIEGPHDAQKQKGRGAGGHSKSPQHKEAATAAAAKVTSAAAFAATIAAERSPKQLSQASGEPQSAALATHQASTASDGARSEHEEWVPKCGVSKPTENASGTHLQDEAAKCAATVAQQHMQAAEGSAAAAEASALRCVEIETQLRCLADKAAAGAASDRLMLKEAFQAVVTAAARSQKHVEALCAATEEATTEVLQHRKSLSVARNQALAAAAEAKEAAAAATAAVGATQAAELMATRGAAAAASAADASLQAAEQIRLAVESVQEAGEFADPAKAAAEAAVTAAESASAAKAAAAIAAAQAASSQEASKTATRGAVASLKAADTAVRAERVAAEQLGMVVVATSHISQKVSLILSHREGASTATANPNAAGVSTGKLTIGASGKKPHLIPPDGAGVVVEIRSASKGVEGRQQKLNHSAKRPGAPGTSNEVVAAKSSGSRPSCWTRLPALPAEPSGSTCTAGDSAIDISQRSHTSVIKNTESRSNNNSSTRSSENNKQATRGVVIARVRQPQTTHTKGIMAPVMEPSRSTVSPAVTAASALRVESSSVLSLESSSSCKICPYITGGHLADPRMSSKHSADLGSFSVWQQVVFLGAAAVAEAAGGTC